MAIQPVKQGSAFAFRNVINNNFEELENSLIETNNNLNDFNNNLKVLSGTSDPNNSTVAKVKGQLYLNTTSGELFYCSNINDTIYTWAKVSTFSGNYEDLENIPEERKAVLYTNQSLNLEEQQQARNNINAQEKGSYLSDSSAISFTQASTRENINTTDTLKIILGKIKKYFSDLGTAAFVSTGRSTNNVPIIGSTLSTTKNTPVVTNSSGYLITHASGALGTAAFKDITTSSSNSTTTIPTSSVVYDKMNKSGGTFTGTVYAGNNYQSYNASLLRNSRISSSWDSPSYSGEIVWVYE